MAKKKKKTIKIEIPVPEFPSSSRIKKSVDLDKGKRALQKKIPKSFDSEKAKKYLHENKKLLAVAVVVIVAIIAVSFVPGYLQRVDDSEKGQYVLPQKVNRTKTISVTVPLNISFDDYLDNYVFYSDDTITLTGFLLNRIEESAGREGTLGFYVYYVVDDFGNKIHLIELNQKQKAYFETENTTKDLFNVTGQIRTKFEGFDFEVSDIVSTQRPTKTVTKQIVVEE